MKDYKALITDVEAIVREAAKLAIHTEFDVAEKGDVANIVTTNDIKVQEFLCEKLKELVPNPAFYCEEEDIQSLDGEFVWIIDPIDGTTNYARGINECAVSVALLHKGKAVLGVVYNIFRDELFSAIRGEGAYFNGKQIKVSNKNFSGGIFCTALCLYRKDLAPICSNIALETFSQCSDVRRFGSAALEICYLAKGLCDLYFEIRLFPWDYAAAKLILEEAGGLATNLYGEEVGYNKPSVFIAANNEENQKRLRSIIQKHMKEVPYEN